VPDRGTHRTHIRIGKHRGGKTIMVRFTVEITFTDNEKEVIKAADKYEVREYLFAVEIQGQKIEKRFYVLKNIKKITMKDITPKTPEKHKYSYRKTNEQG
jgi:hypothetical protein